MNKPAIPTRNNQTKEEIDFVSYFGINLDGFFIADF